MKTTQGEIAALAEQIEQLKLEQARGARGREGTTRDVGVPGVHAVTPLPGEQMVHERRVEEGPGVAITRANFTTQVAALRELIDLQETKGLNVWQRGEFRKAQQQIRNLRSSAAKRGLTLEVPEEVVPWLRARPSGRPTGPQVEPWAEGSEASAEEKAELQRAFRVLGQRAGGAR